MALAASGQTPAAGGLTIGQAVREAVEKNLGLLAERYNVSIAEARIITAKLRPNPVFTGGIDYADWLGTGFNAQNGGGPGEVTVRTDFLFERGGKRERRTEVAETARSVAQLQLLNSIRTLVLDVRSAFVDVQPAKENMALAQRNLQSLESLLEISATRVRAGDLAKVELTRTQVAALQYRNTVLQTASKLRIARTRLQSLLGRTAHDPDFDVGGDIRRDSGQILAATVVSAALELRPDLQAVTRDQARSQADLRLQLAQGKVDYTLGVQYHRQYDNARGSSLGVFFGAPIPLFHKNQGEIERARREQQQILARIKALQNDIRTEAANAHQQYSTARALVEGIEHDMLKQAEEVRETIDYSYRRGEASLVELLDAQRAFNDTMQAYNEARAEYARSLYAIDAISGKAVTP
jgi:cobalt-zinc-cadmium efflux system outer membrane protein